MQESTSREKILKRIRQALIHKSVNKYPNVDWEKPIHSIVEGMSLEEQFAQAFTKLGGQFFFCENEIEFLESIIALARERKWEKVFCFENHLRTSLEKVEFPLAKNDDSFDEGMTSITGCEALIARLGSILVSSKSASGRRLVVVPTIHVVVAYTDQLVQDIKDGLTKIRDKYGDNIPSLISNIAGPSRTADIEKTLVSPAHGPRDIIVFLIDAPQQKDV